MNRADVVRQLLDRGETATRIEPLDGNAGAAPTAPAKKKTAATSSSSSATAGLGARLRTLGTGRRPTIKRAEMATFIRTTRRSG